MNIRLFRTLWVVLIVLSITLACNLFSRTTGKIAGAKNTAQAFVTEVKGIATEGSKIIGTVQAVATDIPEFIDTVEAYATEKPGLVETAKAVATEGLSLGNPPEDIPLPPTDKVGNFVGTESVVSFNTDLGYQYVKDFYKTEMIANGWEEVENGALELRESTILKYEKANRVAIISIFNNPITNNVDVLILINQ